jgi:hypothetical protein
MLTFLRCALRQPHLQSRCHEIEEGVQLDLQEPSTGIDETDGPGAGSNSWSATTNAPACFALAIWYESRGADNGRALVTAQAQPFGLDLVFSLRKSVTLAAEYAATPVESAAIWNLVDRAGDPCDDTLRRSCGPAADTGRGQLGALFLRGAARQATALQPELHRLRTSVTRLQRQAERAASTDPDCDDPGRQIFTHLQDINRLQYRLLPQSPSAAVGTIMIRYPPAPEPLDDFDRTIHPRIAMGTWGQGSERSQAGEGRRRQNPHLQLF